jgi:hypothetical protein
MILVVEYAFVLFHGKKIILGEYAWTDFSSLIYQKKILAYFRKRRKVYYT